MIVYVLYSYYDYNRISICKVVSSSDEAKRWLESDTENFYEEFVVDAN